MKRKTDPLDSVAGQILENAKKSGLEINLRSRPLVMSTACSRLEPCAPSAA